MNFIDNIEIKNFKSIRHQKIEGCKRINVFLGYPNVGKSNILEAISLMVYAKNSFINLKELCRYESLINVYNDGDNSKDAEVWIGDLKLSLVYHSEQHGQIILEKISRQGGLLFHDPQVKRQLSVNSVGEVRFESGGINEPEVSDIKKYEFRSNTTISKNNAKNLEVPFGQNLPLVLRHNKSLRQDCGELFSEYDLKLIFDKDDKLVVQKQLDEFTAFQFSFSQVAETLQRLIFNKAAIASNEKTVLLFEEPEAHMFPPYISKFTSDIIFDKNENQYFLTTHSPYVVNDFMENLKKEELSIYTVGYEKLNGETLIKRLSDEELHDIYQYGVDLFLNLENYLPNAQQQ
ncbi:MAG: AAA family ATPase [Ferruginibacter sp.]